MVDSGLPLLLLSALVMFAAPLESTVPRQREERRNSTNQWR